MSEKPALPSKEERLAAALRENLRKRKAQARAREAACAPVDPVGGVEDAERRQSQASLKPDARRDMGMEPNRR